MASNDDDSRNVRSAAQSTENVVKKSYTSRAARQAARRAALARQVLIDEGEVEEPKTVDLAPNFASDSIVNFTWGTMTDTPYYAKAPKRKSLWNTGPSTEEAEEIASKRRKKTTIPAKNSPAKSPFLRLSLEIREKIYAYLLKHPQPILLHQDWRAVHYPITQSHSLLLTCHQLHDEASAYFYKNNIFKALVREDRTWFTTLKISPFFLPLFKNVVLDCEKKNYDREWLGKTAKCVEILVDARVYLESFTIVVEPAQVRLGKPSHRTRYKSIISFADWFRPHERNTLLAAISRLRCKTLKVVVKVPAKVDVDVNEAIDAQDTELINEGLEPKLGLMSKKIRKVLVEVDVKWLGQEENYQSKLQEMANEVGTGESGIGVDGTGAGVNNTLQSSQQQREASNETPIRSLEDYPSFIAARSQRKETAQEAIRKLKSLILDLHGDADAAVLRGGCRFMEDNEQ